MYFTDLYGSCRFFVSYRHLPLFPKIFKSLPVVFSWDSHQNFPSKSAGMGCNTARVRLTSQVNKSCLVWLCLIKGVKAEMKKLLVIFFFNKSWKKTFQISTRFPSPYSFIKHSPRGGGTNTTLSTGLLFNTVKCATLDNKHLKHGVSCKLCLQSSPACWNCAE